MAANSGTGPEAGPDLSVLADPVRRRLYEHVAGQSDPVRRDAAAAAAGVSRTLAAYHLDRLTDAGLLATSYARPPGRTGPGAGRPAKLYQRVQDEVSVTIPPRSYRLLAELFAEAIAHDRSGQVRAALTAAAENQGRAAADSDDGLGLLDTLQQCGYQPAANPDGAIGLRNCPFHQLARQHVDLVCGLNHSLIRGVLAGHGEDPDRADLVPSAGRCCVVLHQASR